VGLKDFVSKGSSKLSAAGIDVWKSANLTLQMFGENLALGK
jgi:hypothetical protein